MHQKGYMRGKNIKIKSNKIINFLGVKKILTISLRGSCCLTHYYPTKEGMILERACLCEYARIE